MRQGSALAKTVACPKSNSTRKADNLLCSLSSSARASRESIRAPSSSRSNSATRLFEPAASLRASANTACAAVSIAGVAGRGGITRSTLIQPSRLPSVRTRSHSGLKLRASSAEPTGRHSSTALLELGSGLSGRHESPGLTTKSLACKTSGALESHARRTVVLARLSRSLSASACSRAPLSASLSRAACESPAFDSTLARAVESSPSS